MALLFPPAVLPRVYNVLRKSGMRLQLMGGLGVGPYDPPWDSMCSSKTTADPQS